MKTPTTYHLMVTHPAPYLTQDRVVFTAESYEEAVEVAKKKWFEVCRTVALYSGEYGTYYWFYIDGRGEWINRNTIGGVRETGSLLEVAK